MSVFAHQHRRRAVAQVPRQGIVSSVKRPSAVFWSVLMPRRCSSISVRRGWPSIQHDTESADVDDVLADRAAIDEVVEGCDGIDRRRRRAERLRNGGDRFVTDLQPTMLLHDLQRFDRRRGRMPR